MTDKSLVFPTHWLIHRTPTMEMTTARSRAPSSPPSPRASWRAAGAAATRRLSVTGPIWEASDAEAPLVELYTKGGCSLCDEAKAVLEACRDAAPHSLSAVDITDEANFEWKKRYKYDIPVLAIDGVYWTKHRVTEGDARAALAEAASGNFRERPGEPDASRLER